METDERVFRAGSRALQFAVRVFQGRPREIRCRPGQSIVRPEPRRIGLESFQSFHARLAIRCGIGSEEIGHGLEESFVGLVGERLGWSVDRVGGRAIESEAERIGVIRGHAIRFRTHVPEQRGGRDDEALVPKAEEPGGEAFA